MIEYRDGRPHIRGIPLTTVVRLFYQFGGNMDSLRQFFKTLSAHELDVAMRYYWTHMGDVNAAIAEEDRLFRRGTLGER